MPLLLAAQQDERRPARARRRAARRRARARRSDRCARAVAGGGARLRASRARSHLGAHPHSDELETLDLRRRGPGRMTMIRLGRIAYVNMAPVFYRLDAEVEEVVGVPTTLNQQLIAGELDVAPISSIEYARERRPSAAAAAAVRLERRCGRVDPADLEDAARPDQDGGGHARVGDVGRPDEGALPGRGARAARRGGRGKAADRRRRAQVGFRGPDATPRSRSSVARANGPADGLRGLGGARAVASRRSASSRTHSSRRCAPPAPSPSGWRSTRPSATAIRPASWRGTSRSCATASARASVPASTRSWSWPATSASWTRCPSSAFVPAAATV